jgi:hypothetical protein
MTSVSFVPDISMQTDDINGRIDIAFNFSMQMVALPPAVILRNLRLVVCYATSNRTYLLTSWRNLLLQVLQVQDRRVLSTQLWECIVINN